jgi:sugar phosphate isomerase/epimerase
MQLGFLTDGNPTDVRFAYKEGFPCLELALFGGPHPAHRYADFKKALTDHRITLAAVSLFGQNYFDEVTGTEKRALLDDTIQLAAELGATNIVFGSGTPPGGTLRDRAKAGVAGLHAPITQAQELGLSVAFYNCHWENFIDRPDLWEIALPLAPGVGVKFDPSHPAQARRDWRSELLAAGPHLRHVHAKDVLEVGGKFVADPNPGLGDIDWGAFFGILYHVGYTGAVCIEPHSPLYTGEKRHDFLRLSARYLRQFLLEP